MNYFTTEEKVIMIKWYYGGNSLEAVRDLFSVHFPDRPIPCKATIKNIIGRFEATGSVVKNCKCMRENNDRVHPQRNENDLDVLLQIEEEKQVSTRVLGETVGKHHTTAWRILKKHNFKSFKYAKHQELLDGDAERRANFCFEMMERVNIDREFLNICFTDECTFTLNNEPNVQNFRYWSQENEHRFLSTHTQYPQKVNVFVGIFGRHIIGPFFLEQNLSAEYFLNLLNNQIEPALEEVVRENQEVWFQLDGCPAHNARIVREHLQNAFNGNVIGPNQTICWPPRSPDLSPNDFFLWVHLKNTIYKNVKYENLDQLKNAITLECRKINQNQLSNVRRSFYDRLGHCLTVNGGIFEHLI